MNWIERLNTAITYIEENIADELNFSKIAKVAGCSTYHFQRMFIYMTDMSLADYIRRRQMSLAVSDLKNEGAKTIDVALKYGYNSPTAFNRAFKSVHGIAPSLVKHDGVAIKSYPPISFQISIKGVEGLNYRIEKREAFRVVGISTPFSDDYEENFELDSQIWKVLDDNGSVAKIATFMDGQPSGLLGVVVGNYDNDSYENFLYYVAVSSTKEIDDTLEEYIIPASTWAIFSGEGKYPDASKEMWRRIVNEWLPTCGYEFDNGPEIEVRFNNDWENEKFEYWLPIKKLSHTL